MLDQQMPPGVRRRGNSLAIDFPYRGHRCRETLKGLPPTKGNIKWAERKRSAILLEIAQGTFDYAHHFPNSPNAKRFSNRLADYKTVGQALDEWLSTIKPTISQQTYNGYENAANEYVRKRFEHTPLGQLRHSDITHWVNTDLGHLAPSTITAKLRPLKSIIRMAIADQILSRDPTFGIELPSADLDEPDPFTKAEMAAMLAVQTPRQSELNMVQLALWTGVRTGELVALAWEDVDWVERTLRIRRAASRYGYRIPKTRRSIRTIELLEPAIEALKSQRALTEMRSPTTIQVLQRNNRQQRSETIRFLFTNSVTQAPFETTDAFRETFWMWLLRKAGVRMRGPKTTRHTYISQMLSAGLPKEWIVRQVGHTSAETIDKHYAKWITEDALDVVGLANSKFGFRHTSVTEKSGEQ